MMMSTWKKERKKYNNATWCTRYSKEEKTIFSLWNMIYPSASLSEAHPTIVITFMTQH